MVESPQFVYDIVAMMLFATIGILIYGLVLTKALVVCCACRNISSCRSSLCCARWVQFRYLRTIV